MHLGTFPNGIVFATFVMARQNYPFENMSVPDAEALFADARATAPEAAAIEGAWDGHLITLKTPDTSLLNQVSPVLFHASFHGGSASCSAAGVKFARGLNLSELRLLGPKTLLGKWTGWTRRWRRAGGHDLFRPERARAKFSPPSSGLLKTKSYANEKAG